MLKGPEGAVGFRHKCTQEVGGEPGVRLVEGTGGGKEGDWLSRYEKGKGRGKWGCAGVGYRNN